jgi:hypothetical protein
MRSEKWIARGNRRATVKLPLPKSIRIYPRALFPRAGETMKVADRKVKVIERRNELRVNVCEPVRLRPVTDPVSSEQLAETVNMSPRGLCVATDFLLKVGMQVELFLRIPREVSGCETTDVRCVARVVRVDPGFGGKLGVGMRIERYEPLRVRDRWVS